MSLVYVPKLLLRIDDIAVRKTILILEFEIMVVVIVGCILKECFNGIRSLKRIECVLHTMMWLEDVDNRPIAYSV